LENQVIAQGFLRLEVSPGRGAFWALNPSAQTIDTASYPEVRAQVGIQADKHVHKLKNWWFHLGMSHPGGLPDDPDHFHFEVEI